MPFDDLSAHRIVIFLEIGSSSVQSILCGGDGTYVLSGFIIATFCIEPRIQLLCKLFSRSFFEESLVQNILLVL